MMTYDDDLKSELNNDDRENFDDDDDDEKYGCTMNKKRQ